MGADLAICGRDPETTKYAAGEFSAAGGALIQSDLQPAVCGIMALVLAPLFLLGSLEFVGPFEPRGWKLAGALIPVAYIAWSVWLLAWVAAKPRSGLPRLPATGSPGFPQADPAALRRDRLLSPQGYERSDGSRRYGRPGEHGPAVPIAAELIVAQVPPAWRLSWRGCDAALHRTSMSVPARAASPGALAERD